MRTNLKHIVRLTLSRTASCYFDIQKDHQTYASAAQYQLTHLAKYRRDICGFCLGSTFEPHIPERMSICEKHK